MDSILQFLSDCGTVLSRYGISFLRGAGGAGPNDKEATV